MSKTVIVVGAGTAGLASAIRLQNNGYDVEIYEKNPKVGGRMYQVEEKGFKFDVGPTIVMMPNIYKEVFEQAGRNSEDYIPMQKLNPIYSIQYTKDESVDVSTDLADLTEFLEGISEEDTLGYYRYLTQTYKRYLVAKDHFIEKPFRKPSDFYNPKTLLNAYRLKTFNNAYNEISKFVKDDRLMKMLSFQTLYIGISPHNGPSIYTIIPMIETIYGVWYINGGMYTMATSMAKLFEELGGKIYLNSSVEEVVIKDKKANGVVVNGEVIEADYVVVNADFPYAMKNLIKNEKDRGKYTNKKIDKMDYSCSVFLMYLGLNKKVSDDTRLHNIVFADDFEQNISDIFDGNDPKDPSIYMYIPTKIDDSLAPKGKEVLYVLAPVPELKTRGHKWTQDEINEYKKIVYDKIKMKKGLGNIEDFVEFEKIFTPNNFESEFNAMHGATFGLAPTLLQSNYFRPQNKFRYAENLYFTGSSVHPGAGVPIALTSAKLAADELMKDDKNF
ncbi:phytoene desaturase family protein [Geotoga petraea]|uniref:Phytoene desaturase n=1 Tax=Geotoga petraea TaxID=28234 RepID=A0A4Z0W2Y0_9BACT|nr:phytoene desaturase family protein [Geotoga petraea]TGG88887.1 phytoene desaturase [Geotoga petraea]